MLLRCEGGNFAAPTWLPTLQGVAVLQEGGQDIQWLLQADGTAVTLAPDGVWAHAALNGGDDGDGSVIISGGYGGTMSCVSTEADMLGTALQLPLDVAGGLGSSVMHLMALSNGRLLAGLEDGRLLILSVEEEPLTLATGVFNLVGTCMSDDDKNLYLCSNGAMSRCAVDLDAGTCSAFETLTLDLASEPTCVAIDTSDNLFVGSTDGVTVFSPDGDAVARASTPAPVAGCCFGGLSFSDLYVAAGDTLWRLKTNAQGVRPPSSAFLKQMDKLAAAGDYVHEGW